MSGLHAAFRDMIVPALRLQSVTSFRSAFVTVTAAARWAE